MFCLHFFQIGLFKISLRFLATLLIKNFHPMKFLISRKNSVNVLLTCKYNAPLNNLLFCLNINPKKAGGLDLLEKRQ